MLDIRRIRQEPELINAALQRRNPTLSVDPILALDVERRKLLQEEETLRSERNQLTKQVAELKKNGHDATEPLAQSKAVGDRIKRIEQEKEALDHQQNTLLLTIPNIPLDSTPTGSSAEENRVIKTWGDDFKSRTLANPKPHWEIGDHLGILDFERGVKVAKSRFSVYRGVGSQLARGLVGLMLDLHAHHGYEEILPPYLVNRAAMQGTGQLPKFEEDMFKTAQDDLFLIPTAEVPLTNLYRDELLEEAALPVQLTAYTPCFRREAGSAGQDTRGLIRQHQFDKVELVMLIHPAQAAAAHEKLIADAERVLQVLELPYRLLELCTGDLGFGAARCVDIEVWMPAQGVYREISSCSYFGDFQARRANLKYRDRETGKPTYLHTLNGSGLAVGRTIAAILENYQAHDNEVIVPAALKPYLRNNPEVLRCLDDACPVA
ncbi:MAG: serine--tRNA ligase [Candidatus Melainabacteria bacterium]|nr:serine--tRNA ligase [Candidatus Melainabacteria bacterium]